MKNLLIICVALFVQTLQVWSQCQCPELPENGNNTIVVQTVAELKNALNEADINNGNLTILLEPGVYILDGNLKFIDENMANLTIAGSTGNRDDVIIKGQGWADNSVTHIFLVAADNFTLANMTIGEVFYHPVQVQSNPADADDFTMQNVRIVDAKEQLLKVSGGGSLFADRGRVLCCEFEFTEGIAYQYYTGGIDAHRSKDWLVKNNVFKNIRSPEADLAEHAIHFWRESIGTIVDGNQIINCDRGIGFGLGDDVASGHVGGLIMNNFVHTSRDVGIGLETSPNTKVYNNTVITENYGRSIEYRFPTTINASIANNLVNGLISDRSSGSTGTLTTNYTITDTNIFVDAAAYDYHLLSDSLPEIINAGTFLSEVVNDIDCDERNTNGGIDIGADEFVLAGNTIAIDELKVLLQGPIQQSNEGWGMNAELQQLNLVPQMDPYENLEQFAHINNAFIPEMIDDEILSSTVDYPIVDWVFVELRSALNPTEVIATRSALLRSDGKVVTTTGDFEIVFTENIPIENYYVAIRHRNHLGVMTANPIDFSANIVSIDFVNPNEPTWGANAQIFLDENTRAMWGGDANIDSEVIFQGVGTDTNSIFFGVLNATENPSQQTSYVVDGYLPNDLNLDAKLIFSGVGNDVNTSFFNVLSHPENTFSAINFVITEQLP